jgi:predicted nucleic acid-binding protein
MPLIVPAQAAFEYLLGVDDPEAAMADLDASFHVEHPDGLVLDAAVALARHLLQQGAKQKRGDVWIAAHALVRGDYVVSLNKRHFHQMGVPCWHYGEERQPPVGRPDA